MSCCVLHGFCSHVPCGVSTHALDVDEDLSVFIIQNEGKQEGKMRERDKETGVTVGAVFLEAGNWVLSFSSGIVLQWSKKRGTWIWGITIYSKWWKYFDLVRSEVLHHIRMENLSHTLEPDPQQLRDYYFQQIKLQKVLLRHCHVNYIRFSVVNTRFLLCMTQLCH